MNLYTYNLYCVIYAKSTLKSVKQTSCKQGILNANKNGLEKNHFKKIQWNDQFKKMNCN